MNDIKVLTRSLIGLQASKPYKALKAIRSSGTQYFLLPYIPKYGDTIIIEYAPLTATIEFAYGARQSYSDAGFAAVCNRGNVYMGYGGETIRQTVLPTAQTMLINASKDGGIVVNGYRYSIATKRQDSPVQMAIGAVNTSGLGIDLRRQVADYIRFEAYSEDGTPLHILKAAQVDTQIGMYDEVNNVMYTSGAPEPFEAVY